MREDRSRHIPCHRAFADRESVMCALTRRVASCRYAVKLSRKVLSSGLWLGLAFLPTSSHALEPSTDHDVVIVGGGTSGLYAAYTLKSLGYDVLILEASNRHGGRLYSDTLGDVGIERGAEELYADSGENLNFVFDDIVAEYGSGAQIPMFTGQTMIEMDGGTTCLGNSCGSDSDIRDYWDFFYDAEDHDNDGSDPLVSTHLESWGGSGGVDSGHRAYHLYEDGIAGTFGTTVEKLGLRSLSRESNTFDLSGNVYGLAPTGYLDALNQLYFDSVVPSNILYNRPVVEVDTSGIKPVAIDSTGVYHYADAIIVTVSLGVLKADLIDFTPDHSVAKQNAIDTIGFGNGMKISLRFSSQFWAGNMGWLLMTGPLASCWVPGSYQPGTSDNVLTCFLMGRNSEVMEALADDAARITQSLDDLDVVFGSLPFASRPTQVYIDGSVQNWTAEPYVLGSYSFPAPGTRPGANGSTTEREVLAQQVGTELYFAGEATHNTAPATVIGAMRSGERAAGEVDSDAGGPPAAGTPTADFSASVTAGAAPLDVDFTDLSSQIPTGWSWNFGDTGTSSAEHPSHQYTMVGTYSVSLTATNASGTHTRVFPNLITVPEPSGLLTLVAGIAGLAGLQSIRGGRRASKL
jgi:monoamine oxidase